MGNNVAKENKAHMSKSYHKKWNMVTNFTKMSNLVPEWIKQSHFEEILREVEPKLMKIENFSVTPALSVDENYSSLVLRVTIDTRLNGELFTLKFWIKFLIVLENLDNTVKTISFLMKVPHESAKMQQMLKTVNFFTVENATYAQIVTKFEELYKSRGINIKFAPPTFNFQESLKYEPKLINSVLMYDMAQDGYRNVNRLECLNVEQTKLVLKKLAQYHAAGAHYRTIHGPYPDIFTQPMFGSNHQRSLSILEGIMGPFKKMFLENLLSYRDGKKYYDKFVSLYEYNTLPKLNQ